MANSDPKPQGSQASEGLAAAPAEPHFLIVGRVTRPHGVRGEVRVEAHTDLPERFLGLKTIYLGLDRPRPVPVERARLQEAVILLKLAGYGDRNAAESLRGEWLQVLTAEAIPLQEGEYFLYQLVGLAVISEDGLYLGQLTEILETGANRVFVVVNDDGREVLLPDTAEVIQQIDFAAGRMIVHLLPGLLP